MPDDDTLAQQEPQQPQPSQRAQDMAALGYEPATIVDDQAPSSSLTSRRRGRSRPPERNLEGGASAHRHQHIWQFTRL